MKRITLWLLSTVSVIVLLFGYDGSTSATTTASPPAAISPTAPSTPAATPAATATSTPAATAKTVTGEVVSTQWGPVQVQLAVVAGKITGVTVLQQPSGNPKDVEINDYALPILIQETRSAQSAQIDMVSGATVTSDGYLRSLQSALDAGL